MLQRRSISAGQYVFSMGSQAQFPLHMRVVLFLQLWYQGSTFFLFSVFADCVPFPNLRAGCEIILSCCHSTVSRTLSLRRIMLVPSSLPINSLAGVLPEAVCGVSLYVKRNSQAFYSVRFDPFLKLKKTA